MPATFAQAATSTSETSVSSTAAKPSTIFRSPPAREKGSASNRRRLDGRTALSIDGVADRPHLGRGSIAGSMPGRTRPPARTGPFPLDAPKVIQMSHRRMPVPWKPGRCDADDGRWLSVDLQHLPDHRVVAAEPLLPVVVGKDDRRVIGVDENAPAPRSRAERREETRGDRSTNDRLRRLRQRTAPGP